MIKMGTTAQAPQRIAVIGAGVAGLTAAWLLQRKHDVTIFEKNDYVGGHTRTLRVPNGPDKGTPVDTGFIVMNHRNYPLFTKVLEQLKVRLCDSSMTFSYYDHAHRYGYSGNSLTSLFPRFRDYVSPRHLRLIRDLWRFAKIGYSDLQSGYLDGRTLGEYFQDRSFSHEFLNNYVYPMGSAIWSSPIAQMHRFPAEPYLHFLENHGLLRLTNRPTWKYVEGGSRSYVDTMLKQFNNAPRLCSAPKGIERRNGKVHLHTEDGQVESYDHVVIGAHADEALKLLLDPSDAEKCLLGAWTYQPNTVILHTDTTQLPPAAKLWSSWNFVRQPGDQSDRPVSVSYLMNRLQNLQTQEQYIVTLNPSSPIDPATVINRTTLTHPLYSFASMKTQSPLRQLNGERNTWFCGSYFGYGFHEDAVRSAVDVASAFQIEL
tara:strand:- start:10367 stop:11656 length:1290 start_codon:yes stop_codon:yes gene_type:complete